MIDNVIKFPGPKRPAHEPFRFLPGDVWMIKDHFAEDIAKGRVCIEWDADEVGDFVTVLDLTDPDEPDAVYGFGGQDGKYHAIDCRRNGYTIAMSTSLADVLEALGKPM